MHGAKIEIKNRTAKRFGEYFSKDRLFYKSYKSLIGRSMGLSLSSRQ